MTVFMSQFFEISRMQLSDRFTTLLFTSQEPRLFLYAQQCFLFFLDATSATEVINAARSPSPQNITHGTARSSYAFDAANLTRGERGNVARVKYAGDRYRQSVTRTAAEIGSFSRFPLPIQKRLEMLVRRFLERGF